MSSVIGRVAKTGDKNFAEVVRHAFWGIVILVSATAVQFLFDFSLAHSFGTHGTGVFYLSFSVLMAAALLGRLGLDRAVIRFIPTFRKNRPEAIRGIVNTAEKQSLILTIPLAIILYFAAPYLANDVFAIPEISEYLRTFAFAIPPLALVYIYAGALRGIKNTKGSLVVERIIIYVLGIAAIFSFGLLMGVEGVIIGFTVAIYFSAFIGKALIGKHVSGSGKSIAFDAKKLMIVAVPLLFVAFATQMNGQTSVLILGASGSASDVGIFNIALKISLLMTLVLTAVNVIAATKIAELYGKNKIEALDVLIGKLTALCTVCALPIAALLIAFPEIFLGFFGKGFVAGSVALVILVLGQFVNVAVGSTGYVLAMTGHEKALALNVVGSLVFNIVIGFMLIPTYGIVGASISASLTLAISNIIMVLQVHKYLGIWQLPFVAMSNWLTAAKSREGKS